jgi:hypothetical protein
MIDGKFGLWEVTGLTKKTLIEAIEQTRRQGTDKKTTINSLVSYHKALKKLLAICREGELLGAVNKARSLAQKRARTRKSALTYSEYFGPNVTPETHLHFLPYHLANPVIRTDVAYSTLANKNYELLPDEIAAKVTVPKLLQQTLSYCEDKLLEMILMAHRPHYPSSYSNALGQVTLKIQDFELTSAFNKLKVEDSLFILPVVTKLTVNDATIKTKDRLLQEHYKRIFDEYVFSLSKAYLDSVKDQESGLVLDEYYPITTVYLLKQAILILTIEELDRQFQARPDLHVDYTKLSPHEMKVKVYPNSSALVPGVKANFEVDLNIQHGCKGEEVLQLDALGYLDLSCVVASSPNFFKVSGLKEIFGNIRMLEVTSQSPFLGLERMGEVRFQNSKVWSLAFLEEMRDLALETLMSLVFEQIAHRPQNLSCNVRFFRLNLQKEHESILNQSQDEKKSLVVQMERFIRPKFFNMMNEGRQTSCFITADMAGNKMLTLQPNTTTGGIEVTILDKNFEEIRLGGREKQIIAQLFLKDFDLSKLGLELPRLISN